MPHPKFSALHHFVLRLALLGGLLPRLVQPGLATESHPEIRSVKPKPALLKLLGRYVPGLSARALALEIESPRRTIPLTLTELGRLSDIVRAIGRFRSLPGSTLTDPAKIALGHRLLTEIIVAETQFSQECLRNLGIRSRPTARSLTTSLTELVDLLGILERTAVLPEEQKFFLVKVRQQIVATLLPAPAPSETSAARHGLLYFNLHLELTKMLRALGASEAELSELTGEQGFLELIKIDRWLKRRNSLTEDQRKIKVWYEAHRPAIREAFLLAPRNQFSLGVQQLAVEYGFWSQEAFLLRLSHAGLAVKAAGQFLIARTVADGLQMVVGAPKSVPWLFDEMQHIRSVTDIVGKLMFDVAHLTAFGYTDVAIRQHLMNRTAWAPTAARSPRLLPRALASALPFAAAMGFMDTLTLLYHTPGFANAVKLAMLGRLTDARAELSNALQHSLISTLFPLRLATTTGYFIAAGVITRYLVNALQSLQWTRGLLNTVPGGLTLNALLTALTLVGFDQVVLPPLARFTTHKTIIDQVTDAKHRFAKQLQGFFDNFPETIADLDILIEEMDLAPLIEKASRELNAKGGDSSELIKLGLLLTLLFDSPALFFDQITEDFLAQTTDANIGNHNLNQLLVTMEETEAAIEPLQKHRHDFELLFEVVVRKKLAEAAHQPWDNRLSGNYGYVTLDDAGKELFEKFPRSTHALEKVVELRVALEHLTSTYEQLAGHLSHPHLTVAEVTSGVNLPEDMATNLKDLENKYRYQLPLGKLMDQAYSDTIRRRSENLERKFRKSQQLWSNPPLGILFLHASWLQWHQQPIPKDYQRFLADQPEVSAALIEALQASKTTSPGTLLGEGRLLERFANVFGKAQNSIDPLQILGSQPKSSVSNLIFELPLTYPHPPFSVSDPTYTPLLELLELVHLIFAENHQTQFENQTVDLKKVYGEMHRQLAKWTASPPATSKEIRSRLMTQTICDFAKLPGFNSPTNIEASTTTDPCADPPPAGHYLTIEKPLRELGNGPTIGWDYPKRAEVRSSQIAFLTHMALKVLPYHWNRVIQTMELSGQLPSPPPGITSFERAKQLIRDNIILNPSADDTTDLFDLLHSATRPDDPSGKALIQPVYMKQALLLLLYRTVGKIYDHDMRFEAINQYLGQGGDPNDQETLTTYLDKKRTAQRLEVDPLGRMFETMDDYRAGLKKILDSLQQNEIRQPAQRAVQQRFEELMQQTTKTNR